jgi:integrase
MRVPLKGINRSVKRLADGSVKTFWYAWRGKGAPVLQGQPGDPEFIASYNAAVAKKVELPKGTLGSVIRDYQRSKAFTDLGDRTRDDYAKHIVGIERRFSDFPITALEDPRTRGVFRKWRDGLGEASPRQADYAMMVFARILSWALDGGIVPANPCARAGRLYRANRADKVWTDDDETNFLAKSPAHLHLALLLGINTGQREGDLLRLAIRAYDGQKIRLLQRKSQRKGGGQPVRVVIPVTGALKEALDKAIAGRGPFEMILLTSRGTPWTESGFRASWRKACAAAGIVGVTFHDLRGTAVTRLAIAGCSEPEIASITGHSLRDVRSILDANYLHRDPALAESAIRKLETRTNLQTGVQTEALCSTAEGEKS